MLGSKISVWEAILGGTTDASLGGGDPGRAPLAFTSAGDGNWNTIATWTNGTYTPTLTGDTVTIAAGHEVTIPAGLTVSVGTIDMNLGTNTSTNRTKLKMSSGGALTLNGNMTMKGVCSLEFSGGSIFDLNGKTVDQTAPDNFYIFSGSAGSHVTVKSTTGRGAFLSSGSVLNNIVATMDYVDFSGLADSVLANSFNVGGCMQHIEHCTFTDMSVVNIERDSNTVNDGLSFQYNDIRSPHAAGATAQITGLWNAQALGTRTRDFSNNTFAGGSFLGRINFSQRPSMTSVTNNVLDRFQLNIPNGSVPTLAGNFYSNTSGDNSAFFFDGGGPIPLFNGEYMYFEGGTHAFGSTTQTQDFANNVCEVPFNVSYGGMNWLLNMTGTHSINNNLFIGCGSVWSVTTTTTANITFTNNTAYMNNFQTTLLASGAYALSETEQTAALNGTFNHINNLLVVNNVNPGGTPVFNPHVALRDAVGTQITSADYNGIAGYNNGGTFSATNVGGYYEKWQSLPITAIAGLGVHDVTADPLFVDKTRCLATWDASLGGAGTAASAITNLLARTAGYTPAALLTYVKAGFQPSGAGATAYNGTGSAGANIGFR